ncbi:P22 phage major capsid protein family protein [uncultured Paraglaciecola sp.]|uniref:P22 phage major capsid protein family protein n=1 Tax=uncultured Paraglaciecola sp. TaxID=1765024 RepID=UPI0026287876|nr:P22 phage major capsid protein family protein [uncultured Paraglaciecola sp.]
MSNTVLTPTAVTREALRILHQKLNFIGNIDRQYDDSFANTGAKIGSQLKVRLPNEYTVRTGAPIAVQDSTETSETITMATQKGVDVEFSSADLTTDLDDFGSRVLNPMMSVLAANIESDALSMYKDVYNQVNNVGSASTFGKILAGRKILVDNLAGSTGLKINLDTQTNVDMVDSLKGLYQDSSSIAKQYREGLLGRTSGFDFFENTLMPRHTTGSDDGTGDYLCDSATAQTGSTLTIDTGTGTWKKGDVFTIAGVNRVKPETKEDTGNLQQFVVTADAAASATSLSFSPAIVATGARQNVSNGAANNQALTKVGGASAVHDISLGYRKDAFAFVSADLRMPRGVDFAAREVMDGISMRIVSDYDINNDLFPTRIDVLYGFKTLRASQAVRFANN